jgi:oligopeptide transport system substrate-binding protein
LIGGNGAQDWAATLSPAVSLLLRLCLLSLIPFLASCFKRETAVQRGDRDQILHRGIGVDPTDLDPHVATNLAEVDLVSALFEGLVVEDPVDLHPVPGVARSWDISADRITYTFHLRPDARWSDGKPVTAEDFVASWRRVLTPSLGAENAGMLYVLRGAEAFHKGATTDFNQVAVKATDPQTLRVVLEHPTPHFLSLLTHAAWLPVPLAAVTAHGDGYARGVPWTRPGRLVGNGAFNLKAWQPNREIVVERSPTYWDAARVRLNGIHFYPIENQDAEERAFRSGQLHITYTLPFGKVDSYRRNAPQSLRTDPYLHTYFFRLNVRQPPLNNERVRRALALAVDRTAIVEKILRGGQQPATAISPPGLPGYTPPPGTPSDFNAARALLVEAGFPDGKGLPPLEMLYKTSANQGLIAEAVQEMWRRELGIEVRLINQEFKVVLAERRAGNYQILLSDWVGDYIDPITFLDLWRSDSGNNHTGWANSDYDALLFAAARTGDLAARATQLQRAEALMLAAAPIVPIYYNTHIFLVQPSVRGWNPTLLDHHPYKHVWLEK